MLKNCEIFMPSPSLSAGILANAGYNDGEIKIAATIDKPTESKPNKDLNNPLKPPITAKRTSTIIIEIVL